MASFIKGFRGGCCRLATVARACYAVRSFAQQPQLGRQHAGDRRREPAWHGGSENRFEPGRSQAMPRARLQDIGRHVARRGKTREQTGQSPRHQECFFIAGTTTDCLQPGIGQGTRQPGQERQAMVRLDQLQPVAAREVAQAAGPQYAADLGHQPGRVRNMFVNVVADDHVEAAVLEWQLHPRGHGKGAMVARIGIARSGSDTVPVDIDANRESDTRRERQRDQAMRRPDIEQARLPEVEVAEVFEDGHDARGTALSSGTVDQSLLARVAHGAGSTPRAEWLSTSIPAATSAASPTLIQTRAATASNAAGAGPITGARYQTNAASRTPMPAGTKNAAMPASPAKHNPATTGIVISAWAIPMPRARKRQPRPSTR